MKTFLFYLCVFAALANILSGMYLIKHGIEPWKALAMGVFWIVLATIRALEIGARKP